MKANWIAEAQLSIAISGKGNMVSVSTRIGFSVIISISTISEWHLEIRSTRVLNRNGRIILPLVIEVTNQWKSDLLFQSPFFSNGKSASTPSSMYVSLLSNVLQTALYQSKILTGLVVILTYSICNPLQPKKRQRSGEQLRKVDWSELFNSSNPQIS